MVSGITRDYSGLQIFHVFFDTSTYDEVEKDVKVTLEGMLGVVGGTMGLLTGEAFKFYWKSCFLHISYFAHYVGQLQSSWDCTDLIYLTINDKSIFERRASPDMFSVNLV